MNKIFSSATKIVLLYMVFILGLVVTFGIIWDVIHNQYSEVSKVIIPAFTSAIGFLFGHYFRIKDETPQPPISQ